MLSLEHVLLMLNIDGNVMAIINVAVLVGITTPLIYLLVIKPFIIARDLALAHINHLAHVDPLTQLANRRLVSKHLQKIIAGIVRHKVYGALLLLDLDGFKPINDAHGHDAGDAVLIEIAKRLQSISRSEDIVGRLGGDEFVVLINYLDVDKQIAQDKASRISQKLINRVSEPFYFNEKTLYVGASVGIRLLGIEELNADIAISEADIAMYRAKRAGKGCVISFEK